MNTASAKRRNQTRIQLEQLPSEMFDLQRVGQEVSSGTTPLPSAGWWAMTVPSLMYVVSEVLGAPARRSVVECGSGTTTVWLAMALRHVGEGHVWSLEHDPVFAARTRQALAAQGLDDWATVIDAPLAPVDVEGEGLLWYSFSDDALPDDIDLLVVDGPPGAVAPKSRYPAFPRLGSRLVDGACLFLDDTVRPEERAVAAEWSRSPVGGRSVRAVREISRSTVMSVSVGGVSEQR
ncbi:class I SAM-dependent methyltransferase [Paraoerskovia sediminicola]|nr:class I SAM-dependent methyltransferase [Paraoerskovia sediminicola]